MKIRRINCIDRRKLRRANMIWRGRVLGFCCGIGLGVATWAAMVLADTAFEHRVITDHEVLVYVVGPGSVLLFSILGWFIRGAYNSISARLKRIEEDMIRIPAVFLAKDDWRTAHSDLAAEIRRDLDNFRRDVSERIDMLLRNGKA